MSPGGARRSQEEPGGERRSQKEPEGIRGSQEEPGGAPGPRGGQPGPLKSCQGRLKSFSAGYPAKIPARNLYRGEGVLLAGSESFRILPAFCRLLAASCRLLLHPCVPFLGSKTVSKHITKNIAKIPPRSPKLHIFCDLSVISFSTTLGSTFKLDHYSI